MQPVERELIIEVWERQCDLDEQATQSMVEQFGAEQPAMMMYLAAMSENEGDEAEDSQMIPLALTIWEAMTRSRAKPLSTVSPDEIDRAEAANTEVLEQLEEANEVEWNDTATGVFTSYNQRELLGFCLEILMAQDEDAPDLAPDRIGLELVVLKTLMDCFDQ